MSSINNASQANSNIGAASPRVHFAEEAVVVVGPSTNPDSCRCRRRDQQVTRRFQRVTSIEVEFSSEFTVSSPSSDMLFVSNGDIQEARDTSNPYPLAQSLFERGRAPGEDNTFNDVYKKDFIEVTAMKARRKMRSMRIDPYPDAIIRRGLHKREPRETAEPVLEEAMMYTLVVGMDTGGRGGYTLQAN